jgi:pimeloyl-ACP methyl ester carboxylesterase
MAFSIARNGAVELAHETLGPATGAPMLLIGGAGTQMIHWPDEFLTALVERGFQVTRFDLRDAGRSTHCADLPPYGLHDMAADAVAVLDALGRESAHVVGVSLGGMIGQVMAVHHADRVASLTSIAAAPWFAWRMLRPRLPTMARLMAVYGRPRRTREAEIAAWLRLFPLMGSPRYPLDEAWIRDVTGRAYDIAHDPAADRRQQRAATASGDRRPELARVRAPTLVVHGAADPIQSERAGRATAAAVPGARLLILPEVGHGLPPAPLWPQLLGEIAGVARSGGAAIP